MFFCQVEGGTDRKLEQEDKSLLQKATRTGSYNDEDEEEIIEEAENIIQRTIEEDNETLHNREVSIAGSIHGEIILIAIS